jgi:hypothetical protein
MFPMKKILQWLSEIPEELGTWWILVQARRKTDTDLRDDTMRALILPAEEKEQYRALRIIRQILTVFGNRIKWKDKDWWRVQLEYYAAVYVYRYRCETSGEEEQGKRSYQLAKWILAKLQPYLTKQLADPAGWWYLVKDQANFPTNLALTFLLADTLNNCVLPPVDGDEKSLGDMIREWASQVRYQPTKEYPMDPYRMVLESLWITHGDAKAKEQARIQAITTSFP